MNIINKIEFKIPINKIFNPNEISDANFVQHAKKDSICNSYKN